MGLEVRWTLFSLRWRRLYSAVMPLWFMTMIAGNILGRLLDLVRPPKLANRTGYPENRNTYYIVGGNTVERVRADPVYVPLLIRVLEDDEGNDSHSIVLTVLARIGKEASAAIPVLKQMLAAASDDQLKGQIRHTLESIEAPPTDA